MSATTPRRSARIAAYSQHTTTHYHPGHIHKITVSQRLSPLQSQMAGYVKRLTAITHANSMSAIIRTTFDLYRYAIQNPLPVIHDRRMRETMILALDKAVKSFSHPMITLIATRYLDMIHSNRLEC